MHLYTNVCTKARRNVNRLSAEVMTKVNTVNPVTVLFFGPARRDHLQERG